MGNQRAECDSSCLHYCTTSVSNHSKRDVRGESEKDKRNSRRARNKTADGKRETKEDKEIEYNFNEKTPPLCEQETTAVTEK